MKSVKAMLAIAFMAMLVQSPAANAASPYDEVVNTIDMLRISDGNGGSADISRNWRLLLAECQPSASESLESVIENGGSWLVIQEDGDEGDAYIRWTSEESIYTSFFMNKSEYPSWGTSPGVFSVARINWYKSDGRISCEYYPTVENSKNNALISSPYSSQLALYFSNYSNSYPEGYEGITIPGQPPAAKYVAMGDSYSSGQGNPPFEVGTDTSEGYGENKCHRSLEAYPRLLDEDSELELGLMYFVACAGATTSSLSVVLENEPSQMSALSGETEVVTLTIGGNDIGFVPYVKSCVGVNVCGYGTTPYETIMGHISDPEFEENLIATYSKILEKAPSAQLYVADYPYLTAENAGMCGVFDFSGGRDVQVALNNVIAEAVESVYQENESIHLVDTNYEGSPFEGKYYCNGGESDFHGYDIEHQEYSFHPNVSGHEDYASVIADSLNP